MRNRRLADRRVVMLGLLMAVAIGLGPVSDLPLRDSPVVSAQANPSTTDSGVSAIAAAFADINASLAGQSRGSASWGDYDADGSLDLLLTGYSPAKIYRRRFGDI